MAVPQEEMLRMMQQGGMPEPEMMEDIEELPEGVEYEAEEGEHSPLFEFLDKGNIVDELGDNNDTITGKIIDLYDEAERSMEPWLKRYKRALNLAKLQPTVNDTEIEVKNFPFDGASLAMLPFITEAQLDFNSRAAPELAWADKIVHAKTYGENTEEKEARSERVTDFSNFQLTELLPQWKSEQDKGLFNLAASGTFYKKTYFDYEEQEAASDLYMADKVIFNHDYSTFEEAPDVFLKRNFTRNQLIGFIRGDQEWDLSEDELEEDKEDFEFIEAYTWIDLDDDGLKEPYISIIDVETRKSVCLYPNYEDDTVLTNDKDEIVKVGRVDCWTQYRYLPDPEGGPMGLGWGILLGPMFESINTNMRQLTDAGTLHNASANSAIFNKRLASGRGNAAKAGKIDMVLGGITQIETNGSGKLADDIVKLPFSGPSETLFKLMTYMIDSARALTNASVTIEANAGEAASLYLARLQQGLKRPNSIIMRVSDCEKRELQKLAKINYRHFDDDKYNKALDLEQTASMERDFDPKDFDVRLVADPSQGSDIERMQRAQTVYNMAKDPTQPAQVIDYREATLGVLKSMNTPDIEKLMPEPDPNAKDPQADMQQALIMQQMADIEIKKESNALRKQDNEFKGMRLKLDQQAQAMKAAKEMGDLGLKSDEVESRIQKNYVDSLKIMVDMGLTPEQAVNGIVNIEDTFIGDNDQSQAGQPTEFDYDPFLGALEPRNQEPQPEQPIQPQQPQQPPMPPQEGMV